MHLYFKTNFIHWTYSVRTKPDCIAIRNILFNVSLMILEIIFAHWNWLIIIEFIFIIIGWWCYSSILLIGITEILFDDTKGFLVDFSNVMCLQEFNFIQTYMTWDEIIKNMANISVAIDYLKRWKEKLITVTFFNDHCIWILLGFIQISGFQNVFQAIQCNLNDLCVNDGQ